MSTEPLAEALQEAGGVRAPREHHARLRGLLSAALGAGADELALARSGQRSPVPVGIAADGSGLLAVAPVDAALRADPAVLPERGWLLVAALVGALAEAGAAVTELRAGGLDGRLVLRAPGAGEPEDAELAVLAFDEQVAAIDRLRARALALPPELLATGELRAPIGPAHPLLVAATVAAHGGRPADPASVAEHEDDVLAALAARAAASGVAAPRPHEDPDPVRRVARRILQRLDGMGKWGGYHTEFSHLARGFAGNERALAEAVGEALLAAEVLREKPSVGQRHVFLNPGRAGDIRSAIDDGVLPADVILPPAE
ncbi:hypothetical protein [Paraconexibacter algicola]|uniref:hypothetical protein n=1 Tax=Paraconexibacter algicola TaxID=2133960 RepID=UPI001304EE27|nr:hypothetical protein [Paraconexibacter algicola]